MSVTLTASTVIALVLALPGAAAATVRTVDDSGGADFTTIGEAVAACVDGDTILVRAGTYTGPQNRGILIDGMNIAVVGESGYLLTTIDCEGQDRAFYLTGAHDTTTVFRGLSVVNGDATATRYTSGGAILMFSGAPALVEDCYFGNNTASDGGAIASGTANVARMRDCVFDGNSATLFGGAVHCAYDHSAIRGCTFTGNTAPEGGAVQLYYSTTSVVDCLFGPGNDAEMSGGALYCSQCPSTPVVRGCTFTGNSAANGGGLHCWASTPWIEDCDFLGNVAANSGGGLYAIPYGDSLTVTGCTFDGNSAWDGAGAYIGEGPLTMTGCAFTGNEASYWAGGLWVSSSSAAVVGCTFTDNTADVAGALRVDGLQFGGFLSCAFTGNESLYNAGAVMWQGGSGNVQECTFSGNTAGAAGGAVYVKDSLPLVSGCTLSGNSSSTGQTGGIHEENGGGLVSNTVIAFSTAGSGIAVSGTGGPEIAHCCVFENAGGDSLPGYHHDNMFLDPRFCDMASDDYTLCANSFCLPANNIWFELVGAHGQGCAECDSATEHRTWGGIKALYR